MSDNIVRPDPPGDPGPNKVAGSQAKRKGLRTNRATKKAKMRYKKLKQQQ
jgi:hypothetical protein